MLGQASTNAASFSENVFSCFSALREIVAIFDLKKTAVHISYSRFALIQNQANGLIQMFIVINCSDEGNFYFQQFILNGPGLLFFLARVGLLFFLGRTALFFYF